MRTIKRLLFFIVAIGLLIACSKSDHFLGWDSNPKNDQNGQILKNWCIPGTVYNLSGFALYDTWEIISGKVWQDVANECVGTLEFFEDGNFKYSFSELRPNGNAMEFSGKISPSGTLTFKFPSPLMTFPDGTNFYITDVIKEHACAELWGEGINEGTVVFYGQFNGNKFEATARFMARVASPCPSNDMFDPALVKGDLNWTFGYDLKVVKKEKD
jgi:hypothetical protein